MCGIINSIFGGGDAPQQQPLPAQPPVVYQTPKADAAATEAVAVGEAAQDRTRRRRAMRSSSLLATGGAGDLSNPVTGTPTATGKPTLGA